MSLTIRSSFLEKSRRPLTRSVFYIGSRNRCSILALLSIVSNTSGKTPSCRTSFNTSVTRILTSVTYTKRLITSSISSLPTLKVSKNQRTCQLEPKR